VLIGVALTEEQMTAILKAVDKYPDKANAVRLRALVLLLRYSGLRIMDAAMLSRDRIKDGRLMLRTAKTGTVVHLPLPPSVIQALDACPGKPYPFWTGVSKPKSAAFVWQRSLAKLFKLAGIQDAHAHRFRHSFAVGLLLEGVTIENVSALLGHERPGFDRHSHGTAKNNSHKSPKNPIKLHVSRVLVEGIEPTRPCGHRILSPARLPVPPHQLGTRLYKVRVAFLQPRLALAETSGSVGCGNLTIRKSNSGSSPESGLLTRRFQPVKIGPHFIEKLSCFSKEPFE
jgi:hypothetical protein